MIVKLVSPNRAESPDGSSITLDARNTLILNLASKNRTVSVGKLYREEGGKSRIVRHERSPFDWKDYQSGTTFPVFLINEMALLWLQNSDIYEIISGDYSYQITKLEARLNGWIKPIEGEPKVVLPIRCFRKISWKDALQAEREQGELDVLEMGIFYDYY